MPDNGTHARHPNSRANLSGGPGRGGGRPPDTIREICRLKFEERIPLLCEMVDDATKKDDIRLKALDMLGRFAGLSIQQVEQVTKIETMKHLSDAELEVIISGPAAGAGDPGGSETLSLN